MFRILFVYLLLSLLLTVSVAAQEYQRAEVFGGFSYLNADVGLTSRKSLNGWEASLSVHANRWLAGEGDFSGYYRTGLHDYGFLFGPKVKFRSVFAHALLGVDRLTRTGGFSESQNGFAGAFGGGLQQKVGSHFALRAGADYAFTRNNLFGGSRVTRNNFRASVGVVYMFGSSVGDKH